MKLGVYEINLLKWVQKTCPELKEQIWAYFGIKKTKYYELLKKNVELVEIGIARAKVEEKWGRSLDFLSKIREKRIVERKKQYYEKIIDFIDFRPQQVETINFLKNNWNLERNLAILKAHNGWGKTIVCFATLLEEFKGNPDLQVVFFAKTHSQIQNSMKYLEKIGLKGVALRARGDYCLHELPSDPFLNSILCRKFRAKKAEKKCKFYENLKEEYVIFNKNSEELMTFCEEKQICPYFAVRNCFKDSHVIFLAYAQLFSRNRFLSFVKSLRNYDKESGKLENTIFVFDECHNLVNFSSEIDSLELDLSNLYLDLEKIHELSFPERKIHDLYYEIALIIGHFREELRKRRYQEREIFLHEREGIGERIHKKIGIKKGEIYPILTFAEKRGKKNIQLLKYLQFMKEFFNFEEENRDNVYFSVKINQEGKLVVGCIYLRFDRLLNSIRENRLLFLSGTLNLRQFEGILRLDPPIIKEFEYSFNRDFRRIFVSHDLTSHQNYRKPRMLEDFGNTVLSLLEAFNGRSAVFFASYPFRELVITHCNPLKLFINRKKDRVFMEEKQNSSIDNDLLVESYRRTRKGILLGINGGRNSEGLDFKQEQIKLIVLAGLPISAPTPLRDHYARIYNYPNVYNIPALYRSQQSIGRAIRDETQKAVIMILDHRFVQKQFLRNLPADLQIFQLVESRRMSFELEKLVKEGFFTE